MLLILCGVGVAAAAAGWVIRTANEAPALSTYKQRDPGGLTKVLASDGTRLGFIQNDDLIETVAAKDFPEVLKQATVAIEDERFYKHTGVDYEGIIRAAYKNATSDKTQGGSTLTMQLVRNLYTQDVTRSGIEGYKRKIREARLAQELEEEHSKEWVLGKYLNTVPYGTYGGQTAIGAGAAARLYFDKSVKDLTLREAAMLAGMPQAPSQYSPVDNREGTTRRAATRSWARWPSSARSPARRPVRDEEGPRAQHGQVLLAGPRALRARLRQVRADPGVRPGRHARAAASPSHDDQPQVPAVRARRDEPDSPVSARPRRSSRSTPRTATS